VSRHRNDSKKTSVPVAIVLTIALVVCVAYLGHQGYSSHSAQTAPTKSQFGPSVRSTATGFQSTIENTEPAPRTSPNGMVWIPGGEFSMGANDPPDMADVGMKATLDARPIHRVYVDGFYMDQTDVTNAQF